MDHRTLCEIGAKWLKRPASANGHGCHVSFIEAACYGENPDVIGFRHGNHKFDGSVLLEAKMSRADFLADRKKPHRINPETGMGKWRYFICPKDLIKPDELPENWGLIYVTPKGQCKVVAGVMSCPRYRQDNGWGNVVYYHKGFELEEYYKRYEFPKYNIQQEFNIQTMMLARFDDLDELITIRRNHHKITLQNEKMSRNEGLFHQIIDLILKGGNHLSDLEKRRVRSLMQRIDGNLNTGEELKLFLDSLNTINQ